MVDHVHQIKFFMYNVYRQQLGISDEQIDKVDKILNYVELLKKISKANVFETFQYVVAAFCFVCCKDSIVRRKHFISCFNEMFYYSEYSHLITEMSPDDILSKELELHLTLNGNIQFNISRNAGSVKIGGDEFNIKSGLVIKLI